MLNIEKLSIPDRVSGSEEVMYFGKRTRYSITRQFLPPHRLELKARRADENITSLPEGSTLSETFVFDSFSGAFKKIEEMEEKDNAS